LKLLLGTVQKVAQEQEVLFAAIEQRQLSKGEVSLVSRVPAPPSKLEEDVTRAIRVRDRSIYQVLVAWLHDARGLVTKLESNGFAAQIYEAEYNDVGEAAEGEEDSPENSQAIWLGAKIPPAIAIEAISIAVEYWPFLRYVHLSSDSAAPDESDFQMFFGGATRSAVEMYELSPWTQRDFSDLKTNMSIQEFHKYVRARYGHRRTRPDT